jgi:hypothetical protein
MHHLKLTKIKNKKFLQIKNKFSLQKKLPLDDIKDQKSFFQYVPQKQWDNL